MVVNNSWYNNTSKGVQMMGSMFLYCKFCMKKDLIV